MASPLKTLVLRYPCQAAAAGRTASFVPMAAAKAAPFSTTAAAAAAAVVRLAPPSPSSSFRSQCVAIAIPRTFLRANSTRAARQGPDLAQAAQASLKAAPGKTNAAQFAHGEPALDWNTFFKLRMRRRRIQLLFSVTTAALASAGGGIFLSTGLAEPVISQIPLDPILTLGLITFAFGGMGWLVGPSVGSQLFYAMNHKFKKQMMKKEAEFFARIKKHRIDPANSSAANPVPDFYGEKIQSVSGYRRWLKDQKAFNKKKTANFV